MTVNITGHVTDLSRADVSGPSALPLTGLPQYSQADTPPAWSHSDGLGGTRAGKHNGPIIRPKGAEVAQNPNVSEGLSVTYSDSRQSESGVSVSERARGPLFGPGKTRPDTYGLPQSQVT